MIYGLEKRGKGLRKKMNKQKCAMPFSYFNTHLIGVYADFYGDFSSLKPNGEVEEPIKNCNLNFFSYQVS